ncbi:MAG: hypothetical protein ACREQM_16890, partial [Candidatus Dormibacteraceae bacterium]
MLTQGPSSTLIDELTPVWLGLVEQHHALGFGGDRGDFLGALNQFQNRIAAFKSSEIARLDREEGYKQIGALNVTAWLRHRLH